MSTSTVDRASRSALVAPNRKRGRILIAAALAGLALGGGAFGLTRQSDLEAGRGEALRARSEAVVAYYGAQYWAQLTPAERDAAHWRAVIEQYESQLSWRNR